MQIVPAYSFAGGNCAEAGLDGPFILARDTKNRDGAMPRHTPGARRRLIRQIGEQPQTPATRLTLS